MTALYISLGGLLLLVLILLLAGGYAAFRLAFFHRPNKDEDIFSTLHKHPEFADVRRGYIEHFLSIPCEEVEITSRDGLRLFGRYYHVSDGAPLEIQVHGYKSISRRDFSASGAECFKAGYNLLLVDQRAHGMSEGRVISFGIKERFDCIDWVKYARERFGNEQKIALYGISMGAASVLMAAGEEELSGKVACVIADCPYSSPIDIIVRVARRLCIPGWITKILAPIGARIYGGFNLLETSPKAAVKKAAMPILLLHGKADNFVPYEMSEMIAAENKNIRLVGFEGAGHGFSFLVDSDGYLSEVNSFIERAFSDGEKT